MLYVNILVSLFLCLLYPHFKRTKVCTVYYKFRNAMLEHIYKLLIKPCRCDILLVCTNFETCDLLYGNFFLL